MIFADKCTGAHRNQVFKPSTQRKAKHLVSVKKCIFKGIPILIQEIDALLLHNSWRTPYIQNYWTVK